MLFSNFHMADSRLHNATIELFSAIESDLNVAGYEPSDVAETAYNNFLKRFAKDEEEDLEIEVVKPKSTDNIFEDEQD